MCKVIEAQIGDRIVKVADIKRKYLNNIVDSAKECPLIDKVILF